MRVQKQRPIRRKKLPLPPDFEEFVKWVNALPISRGAKQTAISGARKALSRGLRSADEVRRLPPETRGIKAMRYGMNKYEEFLAQKNSV